MATKEGEGTIPAVDREPQNPPDLELPKFTKKHRTIFISNILPATILLFLTVRYNAVWIFSSTYDQVDKTHNLKILTVDLDGGDIGNSVLRGCSSVEGTAGVASFVTATEPETMTVQSVIHEVFIGKYWGAVIAMPNAITTLDEVNRTDTDTYDPIEAIEYVVNGVRWATVQGSVVTSSIEAAVSAPRQVYLEKYGLSKLLTPLTSQAASIILSAVQSTEYNITPFTMGIKVFVNTVGIVFATILQFFFAMALSAVSNAGSLYALLPRRTNYLIRLSLSLLYTCLIGISWGLWFEIFREGHNISAAQYCFLWLTMWMYGLISFEVLDTAVAFIPMKLIPPIVSSFVICNITSAVFPIELQPQFFRINYAIPAHNCFELFITIISHGSTNHLYRTLPVMFGWLIVWMPLGWLGNRKRCNDARKQLLEHKS